MRLAFLISLVWFVSFSRGAEKPVEWSADLQLVPAAESPNHQYGLLAPDTQVGDGVVDYLVDVPAHRVLGEVKGLEYFVGKNHSGFGSDWAADSSWGVLEQTSRGRMYGLSLVMIKEGGKLVTVDLGQRIVSDLGAALQDEKGKPLQQSNDPDLSFQLSPDGRVKVRALAASDDREEDVKGKRPTSFALFQGTYDSHAMKWTEASTLSISRGMCGTLAAAYRKVEIDDSSPIESKLRWNDERLNDVYHGLRLVLPRQKFSLVRAEQRAWLEKQKATVSPEERLQRLIARVAELEAKLW